MNRVLPVLAVAMVFSACASSRAPQPAASPAFPPPPTVTAADAASYGTTLADASAWTVVPRISARARCFENKGVWRPTAVVCEWEAL
jgi:hypothetical protein